MKTIVTHMSPDLDAIASVWLLRTFYPDCFDALVEFVPAGQTLEGRPADDNPNIIHVDTGMGKFDHHQSNEYTCASQKIFLFLKEKHYLKPQQVEPLERMVDVITSFDHFGEASLPDADADIYDFMYIGILDGLKMLYQDDAKILQLGSELLNGLLQTFSNKVFAQSEIKRGLVFTSSWGKTLALETDSEEAVRLAQKSGFEMVVRKGKKHGHIRVKLLPSKKKTLKNLYDILVKKDPKATWFYHASGHMILNGSTKNPNSIPSTLHLADIVSMIKELE